MTATGFFAGSLSYKNTESLLPAKKLAAAKVLPLAAATLVVGTFAGLI